MNNTNKIRISILLLLATCCWSVRSHEEPDLLRLGRRPGRADYKTSVIHSDNNNHRKHSISTVTVELSLKDKRPVTTESDPEDYVTAPGVEELQIKPAHIRRHLKKTRKENNVDSEPGASNSNAATRYMLPPEGFLNQLKQGRYLQDSEAQEASTQSPATNRDNQQQQQQQHYHHQQQQEQNQQLHHHQQQQQQQHQQQHHQNQQHQHQQQQQQHHQQDEQNIQQDKQQQPQYNAAASHVHFVTTPAPAHFTSTPSSRSQFFSSPSNYPVASASQVQYVSGPAPITHFNMNSDSQYQQSNNQQNNVRYLSPSPQRVQYVSTASPVVHFPQHDQQQPNQHVQFVSTPAPNVQYASTPASHEHYVSSPVHFVSTPSPIQYSTSAPNFGNRANQVNPSIDSGKQMHIDHFDNAMSGVRSPKFPQSSANNIFTSTAAPMVISTTITPLNPQKSSEDHWRSNAYMANLQLQQEQQQQQQQQHLQQQQQQQHQQQQQQQQHQQQQQQQQQQHQQQQQQQQQQSQQYQQINRNNNFQDQSLNLNAVESANNYVVNVVNPNPHARHRFQSSKVTHQRDLEKETDVATSYSNGDYGWKLTPKKQSQIGADQSNQFNSVTTFSNINSAQALALQSAPNEYRPYPENPFLNHISYPSEAPPIKSAQSVNFHADTNEQQNINVGYSIGFGNNGANNPEMLKAEPSVYANKYPFGSSLQGFTTAFPSTVHNDVVKGVHLSQISLPDQSFYLKDPSNTQDYVASALKFNDKFKQDSLSANQGYAYNVPVAPYKISHTMKALDDINTQSHSHIFARVPKAVSFQSSAPNVVTSYQGSNIRNDDKNQAYKWTSISPAIEIAGGSHISSAKPLLIDVPDLVTPNSLLYVNNPSDVVTNAPFYFTAQKDTSGRIVQTFDHANALKNIQPIDISNVVSYSPTPIPDNISPVTVSPHYIQSIPAQLNHPIPQGHYIQHYPQDQSHISTGSISNQNFIDHSNLFNYKPIDQSFYKDKNLIYNVQSLKPNNNGFNEIRTTSFVYNKPFETSSNYVLGPANDMIGHSSNVDNRHVSSNMVYVPSDAFRNQNHDSHGDQTSSVRVTHDGASNYQHVIQHSTPDNHRGQYEAYDSRLNQNVDTHNLEQLQSNSDNNYRMVPSSMEPMTSNSDANYRVIPNSNQRQNNQEVTYDNQNDIDPTTGSKLTMINGIKVANPYNVDLKLVSDMLRGKAAVDETRLEPIREQMTRLSPIKLDTSALQNVVAKNEQISLQIDMPDQDSHEPIKNREFIDIDANRLNMDKLRSLYKQKNYNIYSDTARPFQSKYDAKEEKFQHSIPSIASEQLHSSLQSILSAHQIGAVMEAGFKSRSRNQNADSADFDHYAFDDFNESNFGREQRFSTVNALASEDAIAMHKHPKMEVIEPYPLLKPPRPPVQPRGNSHKKNEKRPLIGARHNRILMHRHSRPSKMVQDEEEFEDYEPYRITTELRPPPANQKKKTG